MFASDKVSLFNQAKKSLIALTHFSLLRHKQHENHQKHLSLSSHNYKINQNFITLFCNSTSLLSLPAVIPEVIVLVSVTVNHL